MTIYHADGSGFNGKESKYCVFKNGELFNLHRTIEDKTNNEMEYRAVLYALSVCDSNDTIYTDSQLVVNQIGKGWKCNFEHLRVLLDKCKKILAIKNVEIKWISRNDNLAGRYLEVLDK